MTEDEAKTKWCPFVRAGGPMGSEAQGTSYNRWPSSDGKTETLLSENVITLCIGSACMAWRRVNYVDDDTARQFSNVSTADIEKMKLSIGYCGLGGKP